MSQNVINLLGQISAIAQQAAQELQQTLQQPTAQGYNPQAQQPQFGGQQQNLAAQQSQPGIGQPGQYPQTFSPQQGGSPPVQQQGGFPQQQGGFPQAQAQQASVTPDMIQQLITPLVQNEAIKAALTQQMNAMGIVNLPDARADQLPELYARFQQVAAYYAAQSGGQQQTGQQAGGAPSII